MQASFVNAKLHNADWTRALIGEYPSLKHENQVNAVAVHGAMTVTGCFDGMVCIWQDQKVSKCNNAWMATQCNTQSNSQYSMFVVQSGIC